jgi:hypothetical protein
MSSHDDNPPPSAEFCAISLLVEAYLLKEGPEASLIFLRKAATVLEQQDTNVVSLRNGSAGAKAHRQGVAWLRRNLTVWLARYG